MVIWFVRHSKPKVIAGEPASTWILSADGRKRAERMGQQLRRDLVGENLAAFASAEVKALQTAELLELGAVTIDERFGEVRKPWYDDAADHEAAVSEFLSGSDQPGWECRADALARFGAGIADVGDSAAVIATHGTVLSLWLSEQVADFEPVPFWLDLKMPDAWRFETETKSVARLD